MSAYVRYWELAAQHARTHAAALDNFGPNNRASIVASRAPTTHRTVHPTGASPDAAKATKLGYWAETALGQIAHKQLAPSHEKPSLNPDHHTKRQDVRRVDLGRPQCQLQIVPVGAGRAQSPNPSRSPRPACSAPDERRPRQGLPGGPARRVARVRRHNAVPIGDGALLGEGRAGHAHQTSCMHNQTQAS